MTLEKIEHLYAKAVAQFDAVDLVQRGRGLGRTLRGERDQNRASARPRGAYFLAG
jgi:hypothetical protein